MPKQFFYAVKRGRNIGVYDSWAECEKQVKGFVGAQHKKFSDRGEAEAFAGLTQSSLAVPTEKSSSKGAHLLRPSPYSRPEKAGPQAKNQDADVLTSQSDWDVVYTDGACQGNGKKNIQPLAGIGVWWGPHDPRNIAERCPGEQTNNRAELVAIIRALETAPANIPLVIKTDSTYSIQCVRDWIPKWIRNNWRTANGEPVKNRPLIQYLSDLIQTRPGRVQLQHVRGHAGEAGNEGADKLAGLGAALEWREENKDEWTFHGWKGEAQANVGSSGPSSITVPSDFEFDDDFLLSPEEAARLVASED